MKKNRIFTLSALALMALALLTGACANPPKNFSFETEGDVAYITGYNGKSLTPRIPSKIQGKKVVYIGSNTFF
jgi:ABC-type oligopeptide transport system substrate-binding subunit